MTCKALLFWENRLERIEQAVDKVKKGKSSVLGKSAGGRDIYLVEYGQKQDMNRKANYSSACSYADPRVYADKTGDIKPVVLLVGATHGGEIEGIAAILNLMEALETGKDLRGEKQEYICNMADNFRILLIPCLNPDGRARVPYNVVSEVSPHEVILYKHGSWKDGTLAQYPQCFRVHPILGEADYLGGYYNDDGVNLSADNFFAPMAEENKSLMRLVDREAPDFTVLLHTGCHVHGKLIQPGYLPGFVLNRILSFDKQINARFAENGYGYYTLDEHGVNYTDQMQYPPRPFGMSSSIHHACGGISFTYESYEATHDKDDFFSCDNILDCHFLLFEEVFKFTSSEHSMRDN